MKLSRLWNAGACAALIFVAIPAQAADLMASGTVLGTDGKPLSGVTVSLALAKASATTDASGAWTLGSNPVGIVSRVAVPVANGRLMLENGRLSVRFEGRDVSGRGMRPVVATPRSFAGAARAAGVPDTLLYTWNGKVRLRDTILVSRTGIVRTLDAAVNPSIVHGYLTDERDGQTYRTVKIGSQVWMAQNLNFKTDSSFCYNDDIAYCNQYGRVYKWTAAMGLNDSCGMKPCASQMVGKHMGACPNGWHVPSNAEWTELIDTTLVGVSAGTLLKANSSTWTTNSGTDDYGFAALPAGALYHYGTFLDIRFRAYFWTASEHDDADAWHWYFRNGSVNASREPNLKSTGYSLRCLQD